MRDGKEAHRSPMESPPTTPLPLPTANCQLLFTNFLFLVTRPLDLHEGLFERSFCVR